MLCLHIYCMDDISPCGHSMSGIGTNILPCPRVGEYFQKSDVVLDLIFWNNHHTHVSIYQGVEMEVL